MKQARHEINRFGRLVGGSSQMLSVFEMVQRAAEVHVPVLIVGETGTGKELVAREIHDRGPRKDGPFVGVNTGALSRELVASELFGHVKGAFTGATENSPGRFAEAYEGTLFLDEIANMEESIQIVFLRVLEEGMFRPVGGKEEKKADVRLIAATNADLREAVSAGKFREDLLQRLTVFRIILPALRDHLDDLGMLACHFLGNAAQEFSLDVTDISDDALGLLAQYPWPGNVRELKNAITQAAIVAARGVVRPEHIPPRITSYLKPLLSSAPVQEPESTPFQVLSIESKDVLSIPMGMALDEIEKMYVVETLKRCAYNKSMTARLLGISRKTLHHRLLRWGIPDSRS